MKPKILRSLLLMALIAILAPLPLNAQKKLSKTFTGIKRIRMSTASGNCTIRKSVDARTSVDLTYSFDGDDYKPVISQEGDRLVINEEFHGQSFSGSAEWTLTVPDNLEIKFTTGSGNVDATGLVMNLEATTGSGTFDFNTIRGEIKINTGSGDIELQGVNGIVEATAGSDHRLRQP
jgi:DUF4097 and DUF4098 domain-containing protein YvlB